MKVLLAIVVASLLAACAGGPTPQAGGNVFHDAAFGGPAERIDASDVFAVSEAMRRYVRDEIAPQVRAKGPLALFDALYSANQLKLEYDTATTRNAAEAFAARAGNCLSLVIMTGALAHELGFEVRYQRLVAEDTWSRIGDTYFASAHVNVILARERRDPRVRADERQLLTIDFIPPKENALPPKRYEISERTVVAMYLNNRAAEALAAGRLDDAYWWTREAIVQDPAFTSAYNTLGVVYKKRGALAEAERVLARVLEREPGNLNAMQNLALVYVDQGRGREADALSDRIEARQPHPPFHFFNLGTEAMAVGDFRAAKSLFQREIERDPIYHEFHFWLAAAYLRLGETELARRHLVLAVENSPTRGDHDLYTAKLGKLKGR